MVPPARTPTRPSQLEAAICWRVWRSGTGGESPGKLSDRLSTRSLGMATRTPTVTDILGDGSMIKVVYTGLLNGDDGAPIDAANWGNHADRSVHVISSSVFGTGG